MHAPTHPELTPVAVAPRRRRIVDTRTRACDVLVQMLQDAGIERVFGIPGGAIAPVFDALLDAPGIGVTLSKHEYSAVYSAIGYARATGRVGCVVVTSGPGVLNTLTGIAAAKADSVPLLVIAGEVPQTVYGKGALQEGSAYSLNVVGMASHISKLAVEVPEANRLPTTVRHALRVATTGRPGPVLITVPLNVASTPICVPEVAEGRPMMEPPEGRAVDWAVRALLKSDRKVIFAGAGMRSNDGAVERLREVAERLQCPVMTTPKGKGVFPEDHPLALGVFGMGGHPSALEFMQGGVETMLAIGTGLGDIATGGYHEALRPSRALIHVDIEASTMGRSYASQLSIASSAKAFLDVLHSRLTGHVAATATYGVRRHTDPGLPLMGSENLISPQRALFELEAVLPRDTIFTIDTGEHTQFALHYLRATVPDSVMVMTGLAAMGSAVPSAIGAQHGARARTVCAICGDGGFAMTGTEVATAVQSGAPIIVAVFNDERLGMVEQGHDALYGRHPEFPLGPVQIAKFGEALGADALTIEKPGQILAAREIFENRTRPLVVDIRIDPTVMLPRNPRFAKLARDIQEAS